MATDAAHNNIKLARDSLLFFPSVPMCFRNIFVRRSSVTAPSGAVGSSEPSHTPIFPRAAQPDTRGGGFCCRAAQSCSLLGLSEPAASSDNRTLILTSVVSGKLMNIIHCICVNMYSHSQYSIKAAQPWLPQKTAPNVNLFMISLTEQHVGTRFRWFWVKDV